MSYLDEELAGTSGSINIESGGIPVPPEVETLNLVGASVAYDPASGTHTITVTGSVGQQGSTGPTGATGPQGATGPAGSGLNALVVATTNVASMSGVPTIDGVAGYLGAAVLCVAQTDATQNGLWLFETGAWARPSNFSGSVGGVGIFVEQGSTYSASIWICTNNPNSGSDIVGFGSLSFVRVGATIPDPVNPTDPANKHYVDSVSVGLKPHVSVSAVSTTNIATRSGLSTTVDGVSLGTDSMRVLLIGQSTASQNGCWLVHSGAWTRPADFTTGYGAAGSYFFSTGGTVNAATGWVCSNASGSDVVDTNSLAFILFSNATQGPSGATGATGPAGSANATGTTGTLAKFTGTNSLGDSSIHKNTGRVGVGTTAPGNQLSIVGTGDVIPTLGANGGKFALLNDGGAGNYGLLFGVQGTGISFIQAQRSDGTATAYSILMQPNGGYVGFGTTAPTANVDTPTLRVRTGAHTGFIAESDDSGNLTWTDPSLVTAKTGTHRAQKYHIQLARVLSETPTIIAFPESVWKGDTVIPNSATWYTMATITIRSQWMDSVSNSMRERIQKQLIYNLRVGGTWALQGGLEMIQDLNSGSGSAGYFCNVLLTGTNNGTIQISVYQSPAAANASDVVLFIDIDSGGNYAS